ncbi:MAG: SURF1 family protein [Bradymonadaceae bacterium]
MSSSSTTFQPGIWPTVGTVVGLALLLSLGTWQTSRNLAKKEREAVRDERTTQPPIAVDSLTQIERDEHDKRRARLQGRLDTSTKIIVKHRTEGDDPGVWLLQPFELAGGDGVVLVNRGWIPFHLAKDGLEQFGNDHLDGPLNGLIHRLPEVIADQDNRRRLEQGGLSVEGTTSEWDTIDITTMYEALSAPTPDAPIYVVLDETHTGERYPIASIKHVTEPYLTSGRHLSYAVFWYMVALALVGLYVASGFGALQSRQRGRPKRTNGRAED